MPNILHSLYNSKIFFISFNRLNCNHKIYSLFYLIITINSLTKMLHKKSMLDFDVRGFFLVYMRVLIQKNLIKNKNNVL